MTSLAGIDVSAPRIVLASASPARAMLLRSAGIPFQVRASDVDEDALTAELGQDAAVTDIVRTLAQAKAEAIAERLAVTESTIVIGCDSMLEFEGRAYGKPQSAEVATARWQLMRGRSGLLHTGHHVIHADAGGVRSTSSVVSTQVDFEQVSDEEIAAYVATGEPLQVAGAFTLDSKGAAFIRGVTGDHANVVGLSIAALRRLLAELGVAWTDLWQPLP